ncbi:carboxypeptidase-like regulatory domain-containing protein [Chitinophaga nivalis]|uniref:Carboxypeptidase-like regulatory domain-containing protein n=1 Tax=Chitinophaga nivalis TaxID=2991709 RepID=A0ABT3IG38_9BACT|nr:carboxypeptidase-like regulatory domain-containing protein [Chitinophaga nivalis]MCW3467378.1 carboxypeptidase-like regulatory domain-containing protein [Chitinophaga nivalis]MCW3482930.1 carboxypeptidase-like regulatory domain-containing protein [Chitinophaga nivalis]
MHHKRSYILSLLIIFVLSPFLGKAQITAFKDSVIQISGLTMTADSLRAIPAVSIKVRGQGRGTISNRLGVFSIVVFKGDTLSFSAVGFKRKDYKVPLDIKGNNFSMIQLMVEDTTYLPVTIIKPYLSKEEFERAFANMDVPDDAFEIARKNTENARLRAMARYTPVDGREAVGQYLNKQAQSLYYAGQPPPQNIFNPLAWAQFIQAWKRGDFKRKDDF